ncbi:MAG: hypothetical protein HQL87_11080 [Magnetococcales bacterium]|nr:hypothetical protein [Magnetococcales bacterium]
MTSPAITPEYIEQLEKLKAELESITRALENMAGKSAYEVEGRIREFQDKESEIKRFLHEHVMN